MEIHKFSDIALSDPFFDSLKADYPGFSKWYEKKSVENARAYIQKNEKGLLQAFLYLKVEQEALTDIEPTMPAANRLKVGTFKIDAHNTKLGEFFVRPKPCSKCRSSASTPTNRRSEAARSSTWC